MITVHKLGVPSWAKLPGELHDQIRLAHDLREDMVALEHTREDQIRDVWSGYPQVAETEAALAAAGAAAMEAAQAVSAARVEQRTRAPKSPAVAALKEARTVVREARQARRDAIGAVRDDAGQELAVVYSAHRDAIKALYVDYCQTRGLYWATFNDVADHHRTAVQRVGKLRTAGRPAKLRHHRFDGSGSVAVQLQRGQGDPPRTPGLLASGGGKWRNVLHLTPWIDPDVFARMTRSEQRQQGRGTARVNIGSGQTIELPVIVHRMLPADADITGARLILTRTAGHLRATLSVTAKIADPVPVTSGPDVAVHFGWRRVDDDGTLRVATWRSSLPLTVPEHLRDVVTSTSAHSGHVIMPGTWRDSQARYIELQSGRDQTLESIKAVLIEWLHVHTAPEETARSGEQFRVEAANVAKWRSANRVVALAARWRALQDAGELHNAEDLLADIETWRRGDKKMWETQAHGRSKTLGRRDDGWRRVAAWLASTAGRVVLDDTDLTKLATDAESPIPTAVTVLPVQQRIDAAPGGLRDAIRAACTRDGVHIDVLPHTGLTRTHAACGHVNPADDRYQKSITVLCDGCGKTYDQDRSATILMLASAPAAA